MRTGYQHFWSVSSRIPVRLGSIPQLSPNLPISTHLPGTASVMPMTDPRWTVLLVCCWMITSSLTENSENQVIKGGHLNETRIWEVDLFLLTSLQSGDYTASPAFSVWNGTAEESWCLAVVPNLTAPEMKGQAILQLRYLGFHKIQGKRDIELNVLNKKPPFSREQHLIGDNSGNWYSVFPLSTWLDTNEGFIIDNKIKFVVRFASDPAPILRVEKDMITHTWVVGLQSFKLTHTPHDGIELHSPRYTLWMDGREEVRHLKLYPNGSPGCEGYVSLHLSKEEGDRIDSVFEVFVVNKNPRNTLRKWMSPERMTGQCRFIRKAYLLDPSNGFVIDNKIQLHLRVQTLPNLPKCEGPKTTNVWEISVNQLRSGTEMFGSQRHKIEIRGATETWSLLLYPLGNGTENAGFISMYLVSSGDGISYRRGEVFILNKKPENTIRRWFLKNSRDQPGWGKFLKFSDLIDEKNGFVFEGKSKSIKVGFGIVASSEEEKTESCDCVPAMTTVTPLEYKQTDDNDHGLMNKQSHTNRNVFMKNVTIVHGALKITATEIFSATQFTDLINSWTKDSTSNKPVECIIP